MLYWLSTYLSDSVGVLSVFQYLTLRGILGVLTALFISLWLGPKLIKKLSNKQIGQFVREDGPQSHLSKAGTPTMGGALIIVAVAVSSLLWGDLNNRYIWITLFVTLSFGAIGWVDDYKKIVEKNSKGLPAKYKYFWQSVCGIAAALMLYLSATLPQETNLIVPIFKDVIFEMGPMFIVLTYFVIVGTSNAVNLTDGLDGLAIMPTVLVAGALGIFAYVSGNSVFAQYLHIPFIPGAGELIFSVVRYWVPGWGFFGLILIPLKCLWGM